MTVYDQIQALEDKALETGQPDDISKLAWLARDLAKLAGDLNNELTQKS